MLEAGTRRTHPPSKQSLVETLTLWKWTVRSQCLEPGSLSRRRCFHIPDNDIFPHISSPRHAGYDYSGKCAAWAYKCLDLSKAKRVFVLGPSHTYYLPNCAVTRFSEYETPFGNLEVDVDTIHKIKNDGGGEIVDIPKTNDINEHSLEMHLPYIYKRLEQTFGSTGDFPEIVPILVGDNDRAQEKKWGKLLLPYLKDPENAFVVSSDFCHWGSRFDYCVHSPTGELRDLQRISRSDPKTGQREIHETIKMVDDLAMKAIETGSHDAFVDSLKATKNTVCGRHPIGVMMAALEELTNEQLGNAAAEAAPCRFKFVRYERSGLVERAYDSSVSYASAYAVV
jgi:AmmeMemoRadiSam system protein B